MKALRVVLILSVLLVASGLNHEAVYATDPGLGIAVTFPFFITGGMTTATALIQIIAQGAISQVIDTRFSLRFFLNSTGFRVDLTSIQQSLLIFLNQGMAQVYTGGGVGLLPVLQPPIPPGTPGLLLSLHTLLGFRAGTDLFNVFAEFSFEAAAQPVPVPAGGTIRSLQITIGAMVTF